MSSTSTVSVLLPTREWTPVCDQFVGQLRDDDELLVICDAESDPIARREDELPENARVVVAGDPERCSGKANAVAAGMEAAANDRLVWTDDDFYHPPDWLARMRADCDRHGPVSELPYFVGRDPLSTLLEPIYAVGGTLGAYASDEPWGGAVAFDRSTLDCDAFVRDLRRTVSDDGLLSDRLDVTTVRRTRVVPVGGTVRETLERHVRFTKIGYRHGRGDIAGVVVVTAALAAGALTAPLVAVVALTCLFAAVNEYVGVRRWTAALGYPAVLAAIPLFLYALARRTFVWGNRRYRWRSKFDVEVLESE